MKIAAVLLCVCMATAAVCRADDHAVTVTVSSPEQRSVQMFSGKVASVSGADEAKGLPSEIVVKGNDGQQHVLVVKATTTIYDAAWKPISLDTLRKNDRVKVKYITTGEGLIEALSIKQLP